MSAVVLATGGLVLYQAPSSSVSVLSPSLLPRPFLADGKNASAFSGPGVKGVLSLSHTHVEAGRTTPVYAELRVVAEPGERAVVRAPIALAVVLDTSGSMAGEKIEDAKRSVLRLLADMRDDDEIAVVRYSSTSELIQPLARVGGVRENLSARIRELAAGGGTNIPSGLSHGLRALEEKAGDGLAKRVRRIVLVSDGLDGTRAEAQALARTSFASGITVSSLGIGLDFDETYMGSVAQNGHGNFAFIKDGDSLAGFLKRELDETSATTVENMHVKLELPAGVRFVSVTGADASPTAATEVDVRLGSLFAGDERRVIVELSAESLDRPGQIHAFAAWRRVVNKERNEQSETSVPVSPLRLASSADPGEVERGRDGAVHASAASVLASKRQLEAANAYASGDVAKATQLVAQNEADLNAALAAAPKAAAPALTAQMRAYSAQKKSFHAFRPSSAEGKTVTKSAAVHDLDNLNRASTY